MKFSSLVIFFFCLLCTGCMSMDQRLFAPRATAPGVDNHAMRFRIFGNAGRKVDHSAVWKIDGFGQEVFFPAFKNFAYHSSTTGDRLVTLSWTGWTELGEEEPTEFSAGVINNPGVSKRYSLDTVVADSVKKEAEQCREGYRRRPLTVSGDNRRAELSYCPQLKFKAEQEIALHVYIDQPQVVFTSHWVKRVPLSSPVDLDDPRLLRRIDAMNEVVFCQKADTTPNAMCAHKRSLYATGDRLHKALYGK